MSIHSKKIKNYLNRVLVKNGRMFFVKPVTNGIWRKASITVIPWPDEAFVTAST